MDKHLLSHLPPQPPGLLVHTTSRLFVVPETARNEMGRVALLRAGTAADSGGRINQGAGLESVQGAGPSGSCPREGGAVVLGWEDGQAPTRGNCCLPCLGPECPCVHTAHLACC